MAALRTVIEFLLLISLLVSAIRAYLIINKLWSRRQNRDVADSISVVAGLLTYVTTVPFFIHQIITEQYERAVADAIRLGSATVLLLIGTGFFLSGRGGMWASFARALRLERREVADLLKAVAQPAAARQIVEILALVALLDDELHPRERALVESVARDLGVDLHWDRVRERRIPDVGGAYRTLHDRLRDYLRAGPRPEQVRELEDVIGTLLAVDRVVSEPERVMADEIRALFARRLSESDEVPSLLVVVVPTEPGQEEAVRELLPSVAREPVAGGQGFVAGRFGSARYAELVRDNYRALGLLSFVETPEPAAA